jgi:hypothetical protein
MIPLAAYILEVENLLITNSSNSKLYLPMLTLVYTKTSYSKPLSERSRTGLIMIEDKEGTCGEVLSSVVAYSEPFSLLSFRCMVNNFTTRIYCKTRLLPNTGR